MRRPAGIAEQARGSDDWRNTKTRVRVTSPVRPHLLEGYSGEIRRGLLFFVQSLCSSAYSRAMKKSKERILYMVGGLVQEHPVSLFGMETQLSMTWADGMIGVLPVFDSPQAAEKYSHGRYPVYLFQQQKQTRQAVYP